MVNERKKKTNGEEWVGLALLILVGYGRCQRQGLRQQEANQSKQTNHQ